MWHAQTRDYEQARAAHLATVAIGSDANTQYRAAITEFRRAEQQYRRAALVVVLAAASSSICATSVRTATFLHTSGVTPSGSSSSIGLLSDRPSGRHEAAGQLLADEIDFGVQDDLADAPGHALGRDCEQLERRRAIDAATNFTE